MKSISMNKSKVKELYTSMLKNFFKNNNDIEVQYISQFNHYKPHDDKVYNKTIIIYLEKDNNNE